MTTEKAKPVADDFDGIGWREYMRGIENGNISPTDVRLRAVCRLARENLEALAEQSIAAPARRCDAQSAKALDLLQISTCFRGVVCGLLPCACAETLAAALSETKPAQRALRDIISIAKDAQATDALGDIVKRAEEELANVR